MRNGYIHGLFLNVGDDSSAILERSINHQQSIFGVDAYLHGLYPDTVDGITLEPDIEAVGDIPVKNFEVNSVRSNVRLEVPHKSTSHERIFPRNPDALYLAKLKEHI